MISIIIKNILKKRMDQEQSNRRYKKISYEHRLELIRLICEENHTCASVAKLYNYSPSTVKMIIKKYKDEGKVFQKKADKEKREIIQDLEKKAKEKHPCMDGMETANQCLPLYFYFPSYTGGYNYQAPFQWCPPYGI